MVVVCSESEMPNIWPGECKKQATFNNANPSGEPATSNKPPSGRTWWCGTVASSPFPSGVAPIPQLSNNHCPSPYSFPPTSQQQTRRLNHDSSPAHPHPPIASFYASQPLCQGLYGCCCGWFMAECIFSVNQCPSRIKTRTCSALIEHPLMKLLKRVHRELGMPTKLYSSLSIHS